MTKYRESKTPTTESIYAIDYSRRLELFETACKVFAMPKEVRHVWSRIRFFPLFRATLTSLMVVHGDEISHEEIPKGISRVPGRDRTGSLQETSADPSKCDHDRVEKS